MASFIGHWVNGFPLFSTTPISIFRYKHMVLEFSNNDLALWGRPRKDFFFNHSYFYLHVSHYALTCLDLQKIVRLVGTHRKR